MPGRRRGASHGAEGSWWLWRSSVARAERNRAVLDTQNGGVEPLPHYGAAVIEDSKLVSYALNPQSERGQHKARVFESALGFNLSNWQWLKQALIDALPSQPARLTSETIF